MTAETRYALVIRDDVVVGDIIDLLLRVPMCDVERWMDGAIALLADAKAFREAVANQKRAFVERGAEDSPTLRFLAHICVFGQWGTPAALLANAFALQIGQTSTPTKSMVTPTIAYRLLAPACTAVPRDALPEIVTAPLLGFAQSPEWFYTADEAEKVGARPYVPNASPVRATETTPGNAEKQFIQTMGKFCNVAVTRGPAMPVAPPSCVKDAAVAAVPSVVAPATKPPHPDPEYEAFFLPGSGERFAYGLRAVRKDDAKIERKPMQVVGSPLERRLNCFYLAMESAMHVFAPCQGWRSQEDHLRACVLLRWSVEEALADYFHDYKVDKK